MAIELEQDGYVFPGQRLSKEGFPIGSGQGMTLRDWYAGQALAGLMPSWPLDRPVRHSPSDLARISYRLADAMLEAREAPREASSDDA